MPRVFATGKHRRRHGPVRVERPASDIGLAAVGRRACSGAAAIATPFTRRNAVPQRTSVQVKMWRPECGSRVCACVRRAAGERTRACGAARAPVGAAPGRRCVGAMWAAQAVLGAREWDGSGSRGSEGRSPLARRPRCAPWSGAASVCPPGELRHRVGPTAGPSRYRWQPPPARTSGACAAAATARAGRSLLPAAGFP